MWSRSKRDARTLSRFTEFCKESQCNKHASESRAIRTILFAFPVFPVVNSLRQTARWRLS